MFDKQGPYLRGTVFELYLYLYGFENGIEIRIGHALTRKRADY